MSPILADPSFDGLGTPFVVMALWAFVVFVPWLLAAIYSLFALALVFNPETLKDSQRFAVGSMMTFLVSVALAALPTLVSCIWRGIDGNIYNSALALVIYFAPLVVDVVVYCRGRAALKRNGERLSSSS
jgi:hypothetical protein